jgi:hypothetical protein
MPELHTVMQDVRPNRGQRIGVRGQVPVLPPLETIKLEPEEPTLPPGEADSPPSRSPDSAASEKTSNAASDSAAAETAVPATSSEPSPRDLTWAQYTQWRRSKCPPEGARLPLYPVIDELDNAIHEAAGEWGELNETATTIVGRVLFDNEAFNEFIYAAGDALFTINWVLDALGSPCDVDRKITDLFTGVQEMDRFRSKRHLLAKCSSAALERPNMGTPQEQSIITQWLMDVYRILLGGHARLGLISDYFKKVRWHRRDVDQS